MELKGQGQCRNWFHHSPSPLFYSPIISNCFQNSSTLNHRKADTLWAQAKQFRRRVAVNGCLAYLFRTYIDVQTDISNLEPCFLRIYRKPVQFEL